MFRWIVLVIFASAVAVSAYHRHRAHSRSETISRADEGVFVIVLRIFVGLPLFGGVVLYVINPGWMAWSSYGAPLWTRWAGVGIAAVSIPLIHWVLRTLGRNISATALTKSDHTLVTDGPYRWVRHPLYSAGGAMFLGLGLIAANWFILTFTLLVLTGIRFVIVPREETALLNRFGEDYRQYVRRTGAMLPSSAALRSSE